MGSNFVSGDWGSQRCGSTLEHRHHVAFAHDEVFLAVHLDFGAAVFSKQDAVAFFQIQGADISVVQNLAVADGDDFTTTWLLRGRIGIDEVSWMKSP